MGREPDAPLERPESRWAELGLRAIGRSPRTGDLVAFRAEMKLLRIVVVGPDTVVLEVGCHAAATATRPARTRSSSSPEPRPAVSRREAVA